MFDFRQPLEQLNPIERSITETLIKRMAEEGEPWIAAFDPEALCARLLELGFTRAEALLPDELNQRYMAGRNDDLITRIRLMQAWC